MRKSFNFLLLLLSVTLILNSCTEESVAPKNELNSITNPPGNFINKLLFSPQGDFFAGTSDGLFISNDEGTTWNSLTNTIDTTTDVLDILLTSDNYIFIIGYSGNSFYLYRSSDYGNSWVNLTAAVFGSSSLAMDNFENIYLCGSGLQKSIDKGNTWEELYNGGVFNVYFPTDSLIIIGIPGTFTGQIAYSTDNGYSWNFSEHSINLMDFYMFDSLLYAGGGFGDEGGGGVHKSSDKGISWETAGLAFITVTSFVLNNQNHLFIGTSDGVFFTQDAGLTWENVLLDSFITTLNRDDKNFLYAGTTKGTFLRSTDNGKSWHN